MAKSVMAKSILKCRASTDHRQMDLLVVDDHGKEQIVSFSTESLSDLIEYASACLASADRVVRSDVRFVLANHVQVVSLPSGSVGLVVAWGEKGVFNIEVPPQLVDKLGTDLSTAQAKSPPPNQRH